MNILGITALTHDSGVSLVRNNKLDISINEERLSRIKMHAGFPELSYKYIKEHIKDIDYVAVSDLGEKEFLKRTKGLVFDKSLFNKNPIIAFKSYAMMSRWKIKTYFLFKRQQEELRKKIGKFVNVEHHPAHAASVYFTMGLNKVLIVTCDNHGDNLTTTVSIGENGTIKQIDSVNWPHSPGFFYAIITRVLGFTPGKHEGKITGLAAYGNPNSSSYEKIKKLMWYENGTIKTRSLIGSRGYIKSLLKKYSREDLSAVFQRILEETVTQYIKFWMNKTGIKNIGLAGGVFANVKLNQKIKEFGVENIFVFPHMGDGGTGAGAALHLAMEKDGIKPYRLKDAYLGLKYSNKEIKEELDKSGLKYEQMEDIEYQIADLLSKKKVIARFNGAMEFGPRALGNRSILYQATDPKVNDWLNKQLKRCYDKETEILTSEGWKYIKDISKNEIVATLNPKSNALEYKKIQKKLKYKYKGKLIHFKNKRIDLMVTPNHKMWAKTRYSKKFEFVLAENLLGKRHTELKGGIKWIGKKEKHFILPAVNNKDRKIISMDLWLEFFGYWTAEGSCYKDNYGHYRVTVAQSKKSKYYNIIKKCLNKLPFNILYDKKEFIINNKQLHEYIKQFKYAKNKHILNEFLKLSKNQLEILFGALMKGDGNVRGKQYRYATTSKRLADNVQEIALKLGFSSYISLQKSKNPKHSDLYLVRIGRSKISYVRDRQSVLADYNNYVYCVTVPNHIIFVRRNGKAV